MRRFAICALFVACHSHPPPTAATAAPRPALAASSAPVAPASASSTPPREVSPAEIVARWNDAHNRHDAAALGELYAPVVDFYDAELPNAECVRRKQVALAAAPDYRQSVADLLIAPVDGNGGTFVRLTKKTTSKRSSKSYQSYLYVIGGRIVAEGDRVTDVLGTRYTYCYMQPEGHQPGPNDERPGSIAVSGLEAVLALRHSKELAELREKHRGSVTLELTYCAHSCAPGDFGSCKPDELVPYSVVAEDGGGRELGAFVVDPMTKAIRVETAK